MAKLILLLLFPALGFAAPLVDQTGREFKWENLPNHPILVNLSFASCRASCPVLNSRVREIAEPFKSQIEIVTVSVDPDHDTPQILSAYAKERGFDWPNWHFVTGSRQDVFAWIQGTLGWTEIKRPFAHSNSILLFTADHHRALEAAAFSEAETQALREKIRSSLTALTRPLHRE